MDTLARTLILGSGKYSLSRSWFFPVQCSPWLLVLLLGHAFFSIFSIGYILCIYILSKRLSHAKLFSCVWLFATPWTVAHQAPQSTGFSRQEYPSGLPCPPPGDLPNPGIELVYPVSPTLQARTTEPRGKPTHTHRHRHTHTHTPLRESVPLGDWEAFLTCLLATELWGSECDRPETGVGGTEHALNSNAVYLTRSICVGSFHGKPASLAWGRAWIPLRVCVSGSRVLAFQWASSLPLERGSVG